MSIVKIQKKIFLISCTLIISCTSNDKIEEDNLYINIPDLQFETKLIDLGVDSDNEINQKILKTDAEQIRALNLNYTSGPEIGDLTGIEGFVNLKNLSVVQHNLTHIEVGFNKELDTLILAGNYIKNIDVSNNPKLIKLDLTSNQLSSITGLANATHLKLLRLSFNSFEEFSIHNESLENLLISHNLIKSFDVSGAKNLKSILLRSNKVSSIDLSTNTLLETLVLSDNKIKVVNLDQNINLEYLYFSSNLLTNLDVSSLQGLVQLIVDRNPDLFCIKINNDQNIPSITKSDYQELNTNCD